LQGFLFSDINDAGQVAFGATAIHLGNGIFRGDGLALDTIAWEQDLPIAAGKLLSIDRPLSMNNAGTVAFQAQGEAPGIVNAIFKGDGGNITLVSNPQAYRTGVPQINNLGTVAFNYQLFGAAGDGIRLGNGGTISPVIDDTGPYDSFAGPSVNDDNVVAATAYHDGGGASVLKIDGAKVDVIAGPYNDVRDVGLNNSGDVAFVVQVAPTTFRILTGPDPVADKVIGDGDTLFGSTVTMFQNAAIDGPNDAGQIVFRYSLADGRQGIALATPVPTLAGDYNNNGQVDAADYALWRKGGPLANEVDAPGTVNAADYTAWQARFGNSASGAGSGAAGSASATVPEPHFLLMLAAGGMLLAVTAGRERHRSRTCVLADRAD
jgi:hypothetical protein